MSQELYDKSLEALRGDTPPEKRNIWKFGTREVVYSALGAALFAALSWVFNILLPMVGTGNVSFRVPIVVPMFFGIPSARSLALSPVSWAISWGICFPATASGSGGTLAMASLAWCRACFQPSLRI